MLSKQVATQEVINYLNLFGIDYTTNHMITGDESTIDTDVFIPSLNLSVIIEEPQDASPDTNPCRSKDTAQKRALIAKDANIGLVQLTTDEVPESKKYRRLTTVITASTMKTTPHGARECKITRPDKNTMAAFLDRWHTQGSVRAMQQTYGLAYQGQIAVAMVIGKSRFKTSDLELVRYCTSPYKPISGGFQRLMAAVRKDHPQQRLVSYDDLTIMLQPSNIYEKNNFKHIGLTPPDYRWLNIYSGETRSRYQCMKKKLIAQGEDPNLTEIEIMHNKNFVRIFGAGSIQYEIDL
jgi:hypothetical protein